MATAPENEEDYQKFQQLALIHLEQTQQSIVIGGLLPLVMIILNAINIFVAYRWLEFFDTPEVEGFARISPILIGILLSILAAGQWVFLFYWRRKRKNYDRVRVQKFERPEGEHLPETEEFLVKKDHRMTLPALIYTLVKYMSRMRLLFFVILAAGSVNIVWSSWFLVDSWVYRIFWIPLPYFTLLWILNGILVVVTAGFMLFEANLFRRWNRNLKKISQYENEVLKELGLD